MMPDQKTSLRMQVDEAIFVVTLAQSQADGAVDHTVIAGLEGAVKRYRDDPALRVMLIRADDAWALSGIDAGADETDTARPMTGSALRARQRSSRYDLRGIGEEIEAIEKPFVAAHRARCAGPALDLSLACDFRLAASAASYAFADDTARGRGTGSISRLTRIVGTHWARYLAMANLGVDADRARAIGLVHEVHPDDAFEDAVMAFCRHLADQNAEQMGTAKLAIELARDVDAAQARNVERLANSALMLGSDYRAKYKVYTSGIGGKS